MPKPKGLEWNQLQLKIALLLQQGATPEQIEESGLCKIRTVHKVKSGIEKGDIPPDLSEAAIASAPPPSQFGKYTHKPGKDGELTPAKVAGKEPAIPLTTETSEATALKMTPKVQTIPLTPGIFISYMCAVGRGYGGDMATFLDLAAVDFWQGRGLNPFEEVRNLSVEKVVVEAG